MAVYSNVGQGMYYINIEILSLFNLHLLKMTGLPSACFGMTHLEQSLKYNCQQQDLVHKLSSILINTSVHSIIWFDSIREQKFFTPNK